MWSSELFVLYLTLDNSQLTGESNAYAARVKTRYPSRVDFRVIIVDVRCFQLSCMRDPSLRPITAELGPRSAAIFVHPTSPCHQAGRKYRPAFEFYTNSAPLAQAYRASLFQSFLDIRRSVLDLIPSDAACRFTHIRWIVAQCGRFLPALIHGASMIVPHGQTFTWMRDHAPVTESQIRSVPA